MIQKAKKEKIAVNKKRRDPEGTRRRIMEASIKDFSKLGFGGARVDKIAAAAKTNERMLYYYYGSKQGLFLAVLEEVFLRYNEAEKELHLDESKPVESMRILASFMWDYYYHHPEFIRLLNSENLHEAKHIKQSDALGNFILPFIQAIEKILVSGAKLGVFRQNIDSVRFYLTISALGYYILSNRFTLSAVTGKELMSKDEYDIMKAMHLDVLISYLTYNIDANSADIPAPPKNLPNNVSEIKKVKTPLAKTKETVAAKPAKASTAKAAKSSAAVKTAKTKTK